MSESRPTQLAHLDIPMPSEGFEVGALTVLDRAKTIVINNAEDYRAASDALRNLKSSAMTVEAEKEKQRKPAHAAYQAVLTFWKKITDPMEQAEKILKDKLGVYDAEQRRLAELKRQEAEKKAAEARRKAEAEAAAQREQMQMAMSEIQGIQQQVIIAQAGRLGVRKGGTRECIVDTLNETAAWRIEEEHFGPFYKTALETKENTRAAIQAILEQFDASAARDKALKEVADAAKAGDAARIAAAEEETKAARKEAIAARAAAMKAEAENEALQARQAQERQASERQANELEFKAASTLAPVVEENLTQVAGQSRRKIFKFRITDVSKLNRQWMVPDMKVLQGVVNAKKELAQAFIGEGVEVYVDYDIAVRK